MATIKSALELALEKTKDMKVDKDAIDAMEGERQGKVFAAEFMANPGEYDLGKALSLLPDKRKAPAKAGAIEVFMSHLQLPSALGAAPDLSPVAKGLAMATKADASRLSGIISQVQGFLKQYLDDLTNFDQAIRKQYEPKLKQKEQELSRRYGQNVKLDPMQDPEFASYYKQNLSKLKGQYQAALDQAKEDIKGMIS
jgi:hypothetical protein